MPLAFCTTLNADWFWSHDKHYSHPSAATIADWRQTARDANANLLLNVGPNSDGLLPDYHLPFLKGAKH